MQRCDLACLWTMRCIGCTFFILAETPTSIPYRMFFDALACTTVPHWLESGCFVSSMHYLVRPQPIQLTFWKEVTRCCSTLLLFKFSLHIYLIPVVTQVRVSFCTQKQYCKEAEGNHFDVCNLPLVSCMGSLLDPQKLIPSTEFTAVQWCSSCLG